MGRGFACLSYLTAPLGGGLFNEISDISKACLLAENQKIGRSQHLKY